MNSSTSSSDAGAHARAASAHYLVWWAGAVLAGALAVAAVNALVDPLQIYRRAAAPVWSENQRYQLPGLIAHYPFETVVVGTSHAENFLPSEVAARLGEPAAKLAIAGSSLREQRLVLEQALATGKVRRVLWLLDPVAFARPVDALGGGGEPFPLHLYAGGLRRDALYLLSTDTLELSVATLLGRGPRELDALNAWHDDHVFGARAVLADWHRRLAVLAAVRGRRGARGGDPLALVRPNVARNLLPPLRDAPDVRFELIFPPVSILSFLADLADDPAALSARLRLKALVVEATAALPNVRVFDLQGIEARATDFAHFKDLEHFDLATNHLVLDAVARGEHVVDPARYADALAAQAAFVERFRAAACVPGSPRRVFCPPALRAARVGG